MSHLEGMKVAVLEARMKTELADLIRHHGGEPYSVPAVREVALECRQNVDSFISRLAGGGFDTVVFQTGIGAKALFDEACKIGKQDLLRQALGTVTTVCRGPKPSSVLRLKNVKIDISVKSPFTTHELENALTGIRLMGKRVAVLDYGEPNRQLMDTLNEGGAHAQSLCLYEWKLPEDVEPMKQLAEDLVAGRVDVVVFTSQIQVRHLFQVCANSRFGGERLSDALNSKAIVAAVGPTCANALVKQGVAPDVVPGHPKMGHMINELSRFVDQRSVDEAVSA
jgi:uroporphyrinogen-III synthase